MVSCLKVVYGPPLRNGWSYALKCWYTSDWAAECKSKISMVVVACSATRGFVSDSWATCIQTCCRHCIPQSHFLRYGSQLSFKHQKLFSTPLAVSGNGAIRKPTYDFLLFFHCNYVFILHRSWYIITYFLKLKDVTWPRMRPNFY